MTDKTAKRVLAAVFAFNAGAVALNLYRHAWLVALVGELSLLLLLHAAHRRWGKKR